MGKKQIVAAALVGLALRTAVLAGAGDALARFVSERTGDGQLVRATLNVELGAPASPEALAAQRPDDDEPAPADLAAPAIAPAPAATPALRLVAVPPPARPEPTPAPDAAADPDAPPPAVEIRAADLSGGEVVHNASGLDVDFAALAAEGLTLRLKRGAGPQVLILHTHSSEAYTPEGADSYIASDPYRTQDPARSVIRVGDALARALEAHGLTVLHDTTVYDYPSYTGSYTRSGAAVEAALAANPGIAVVIDLHRDALGSGDVLYKTQALVGQTPSAQLMLLAGTGANGLPHPNWRENLKLAMYLQNAVTARYPSLARPVELVKERYNQQLCPGMLILEVGSTGNTLREAITAAETFGDAAGQALAALLE